jgi:7,8-dihydroneopterin aldolase/epimerase/oxygenase
MQGIIGFNNYHIRCILGERPEERQVEQSIYVSVKVRSDFSACAASDDLKDTVDYVTVADICLKEAQEGKYFLLEAYASAVLGRLLEIHGILEATIEVRKPSGLPSAECSFVELTRVCP